MGKLESLPRQTIQDLIRWSAARYASSHFIVCILAFVSRSRLFCRQVHGYQGRTNKDPDSCYSFWVGATLSLLGQFGDTDLPSTQTFLLRDCQQSAYTGGFSKLPDCYPDLLHTFYSLCWLSMAGYEGVKSIDPRLGMCADKSPL
jgi:geranylgeranyl transferase type-1 subunit beta